MSINQTKGVIFGLNKLKSFINPEELLNLATCLGHSKLYYGAPVFLSRNLHKINQRAILRASTNLIKACFKNRDWNYVSFADLHEISNRATPMMYADYSQAMALKSIINTGKPELVWYKLQQNYRENQRTGTLYFGNGSSNPLGQMNFANRIHHTSIRLPPQWKNFSLTLFKRRAKSIFMTF